MGETVPIIVIPTQTFKIPPRKELDDSLVRNFGVHMGGYGSSYDYSDSDDVIKKSAAAYNIDTGRKYDIAETKAVLPPPIGKVLITNAKMPLVVAVDVTGSMRELPGLIFEKLCILYNEVMYFLPEELKESFEISFAAVGDANSDQYSIQVTDFAREFELDQNIKALFPEGGGGGQARETYELIAYYYLTHCEMPEAYARPRPMLIFIGDEGFYGKISRNHIENYIGNAPPTDVDSNAMFQKLKQKFDVFILRITYETPDEDVKIHKQWVKTLGEDRVIRLVEPRRVVDTILGLIAANVDQFDLFKQRIAVRQTPEQVDQVFSTLDGLTMEGKSYMYKLAVLLCPNCHGQLKEAPEFDQPSQCPFCSCTIVRV